MESFLRDLCPAHPRAFALVATVASPSPVGGPALQVAPDAGGWDVGEREAVTTGYDFFGRGCRSRASSFAGEGCIGVGGPPRGKLLLKLSIACWTSRCLKKSTATPIANTRYERQAIGLPTSASLSPQTHGGPPYASAGKACLSLGPSPLLLWRTDECGKGLTGSDESRYGTEASSENRRRVRCPGDD